MTSHMRLGKVRWRDRCLCLLIAWGCVVAQTIPLSPWDVPSAEANPAEFEVFRTTVTASHRPTTHTVDVLNPNTSWSLEATNEVINNPQLPRVAVLIITFTGRQLIPALRVPHQAHPVPVGLKRRRLILVLRPGHQVQRVPVSLEASNTLTVRLVGRPGATATVVIRGTDEQSPRITVTAPSTGAFLNASPVLAQLLLSDDVSGLDPGRFAVRIDGQDHTAAFPAFSNSLEVALQGSLDLPEGSHTLEVEIADRAGNRASAISTFTVTTVPPPRVGFIHGVVFNATTEQPLADATITVRGLGGDVRTGPDGRFQFPTSSSGEFLLTIGKPGFSAVQRLVEVFADRDVAVEPAVLTPLDSQMTHIPAADGGLATNATEDFQVEFPPGAAPHDLDVRITRLADEQQLPGPLPPGLAHIEAVLFEPRFTTFNRPATFRHRNTKNLPPGTSVILTLWNEDTQEWMDAGTGQVTGDRGWIEFPIVRFFCWYCDRLPRALPPQAKSPDRDEVSTTLAEARDPKKGCEQQVGSVVCPESGELVIEHALPSLRTLGQTRQLRFLYRSTTASPTVLIGTDYRLDPVGSPVDPGTRLPAATSTAIQIEGRTIEARFVGASGPLRQAFLWDARNARGQLLPTGAYAATIKLANHYPATYGDTGVAIPELSAATTTFSGRAIVHNQRESVFGAGWGLEGLQRLLEQPDGTVLVIDGVGASTVFRPGPMTDLVVANALSDDVSVFTGHGDGTFQPQQRFIAAGRPLAVAVGQFDGDAFQDVAVALQVTGQVAILLGRRHALSQPTFIPVGAGPRALAVADLNGDRQDDLLVCNQFSNDVSVLLGGGDGTFAPQGRVGVGPTPIALAVGDWNHDGFVDLVTANRDSGDLSVRLGNGDGTFQAEQRLSVGGSPVSMLAEDFNGDGRLDLAAADERTSQVSVLLGRGEGTFQPPIRSPLGPSPSGGIAAGRINNDAFLDLVVTGTNQLLVLLGEGNGTFRAPQIVPLEAGPSALVVEDLNRDRNQDLAVSTEIIEGPPTLLGGVSVLLGNGDGTFQPRLRVLAGAKSAAIATIEFNDPVPNPVVTFTALPGDFSRLEHQVDGTWTRRLADGTTLHFDARGLHTRTVDRNGNETRYRYDAQDRLVRVESPGGAVYELAYNPLNSHLSSVTDSAGHATRVLINGDGNLRQIANPDGTTRRFRYDAEHRLISQTNERDLTTDYVYDDFGRLTEAVLPERSIVDPATGNVSLQREVRRFSPAETQGLINSLPAGSGTPENPVPPVPIPQSAFQDGRGNTTQLATDRFGAPTQLLDPLGRTTVITREVNGLPTTITRPNGHATELSYDSLGNLIRIREADITEPFFQRIITQFEYDLSVNRLTKIVDARRGPVSEEACPEGCTTRLEYDTRGNPLRIIDHLGNTTSFTYDSRGLLTSVTDSLGTLTPEIPDDHQMRFAYDEAAGSLLSTTDQLGHTTSLSYDAAGNVTTSTDAQGRATTFAYDAMNRLTTVVDAAGNATRYRYDASGNLIGVTDANGHATTFTYDSLNQLTSTTNPVDQSKQFVYDLNRNLGRVLDATGQTITLSYDAANQLEAKLLKDSRELVQDTVTYAYDALGNLTLVQDADSRLTFAYDPLGRLTKTTTGDPDTPTLSQPLTELQYTSDANGNRTTLQGLVSGRTALDLRYRYDPLNRLTTIFHGPLVGIARFTYDSLSRLTQLRTDIMRTEATYDAASQLTDLRHTNVSAGTTPVFATYTYDPLGNRISLTDALGLHAYTYDPLTRLTGADHPGGSGLPDETFTYDPVGNRLTSHRSTTHRTDAANRLLEDDTFTYAYDANGNLSEQRPKTCAPTPAPCPAARQFTYDVEHQLIGLAAEGTTAAYRYDGLGRRIEKDVSGTVTRYVYDAEDVLFTFDGATTLQAGIIHGPGIDQPLLLIRDADANGVLDDRRLRWLPDGLGSITALVNDGSSTLLESYRYDSFGTPTILAPDGTVLAQSAVGNPYLFTGREYDPESGLHYFRARYYDPRTGRFLQEDPIQSLNPYQYASNNPLRFADPFGLLSIGTGIGPTILTDPIAEAGPTALITPRSQDVRTALIDTVPERQAGSFGDPPSEAGGTVLCDKPQPDDHELSGHALDRKRQHGLSNERIRRALDSPEKYPSRTHPNRTVHHDPVTNTTVVTEGNRVVTVRPGKPSNYIK